MQSAKRLQLFKSGLSHSFTTETSDVRNAVLERTDSGRHTLSAATSWFLWIRRLILVFDQTTARISIDLIFAYGIGGAVIQPCVQAFVDPYKHR